MEAVFYVIAKVVEILLGLISIAMFLRVILGFFVNVEENKLYLLCSMLTEPYIMPFRLICARFHIGENLPIDIPFFLAYIVLSAISMFLPVI